MKKFLVSAVCLLSAVCGFAQVKHGSEFEIGAGVSMYGITGSVGGVSRNAGPAAYFSYGYRFHDNVGASLKLSYKNGNCDYMTDSEPSRRVSYKGNQVEALAGVDYVMLPDRLVNLFVGAGIGGGVLFEKSNGTCDNGWYGVVGPRIGVSIWRIKLSADLCYAFDGKYGFESSMSSKVLTVGFMF